MGIASQLIANVLSATGLYVLVSLGLSLVYRVTRVFHFAHAGVYTLGAYALYALVIQLKWPLWTSLFLAVGVSGLAGFATDRFIYQPLSRHKASGAALLIASLGAFILIENLIALVYGADTRILLPGVQKTMKLAGASLTYTQMAEILCLVLVVLVSVGLRRRPVGLWLRSCADDRTMALALGLPVIRIRNLAFLIGSAMAGLAACLASLDSGAEPHMGIKALFVAIVSVFVGGPDIFLGPIVGALFFSMLQVMGNYLFSSRWESTLAFVVLLLLMVFRPEGIFGRTRRIEERTAY